MTKTPSFQLREAIVRPYKSDRRSAFVKDLVIDVVDATSKLTLIFVSLTQNRQVVLLARMQWVSSKFSKQMDEIRYALLKANSHEGKGNNFSFKRLASTSSLATKRLKPKL